MQSSSEGDPAVRLVKSATAPNQPSSVPVLMEKSDVPIEGGVENEGNEITNIVLDSQVVALRATKVHFFLNFRNFSRFFFEY